MNEQMDETLTVCRVPGIKVDTPQVSPAYLWGSPTQPCIAILGGFSTLPSLASPLFSSKAPPHKAAAQPVLWVGPRGHG